MSAPTSESDLLARAQALAGQPLSALAQKVGWQTPESLVQAKGWTGQLLERCLGASAGSQPVPDFPELGIELKTLPITAQGKPLETTFVNTIPLLNIHKETWPTSGAYLKLKRVLWIPICAAPEMAPGARRVCSPLLWSPSVEEEAQLRADWEELTDMICLGKLEYITAKQGTWLQVRPKGANAKDLVWGIDREGNRIQTLPRGFYLRTTFTRYLLAQHYFTKQMIN